MYIYAHINKNTLRFVREQKAISFDYVTRITKFKEDKLTLWESNDSGKFPTINQAKTIAKCYRIPFAGLYMNAQAAQEYRKITGQVIPRNMSREAIDQNSSALCRTFFHGYREGLFDKQDISRYLGVKQNHVDKFIWEVSKW